MNESIPPLRSTKVLIVGKGDGWQRTEVFLESPDWNVWAIPQSYTLLNSFRVDLVFELHAIELWRKKKATISKLNTQFTVPKLIVPHRVPGWTDNSYLIPVEDLQALGLPLLNSFAWMLAYAVHRGATEIALRGINLTYAHEGLAERDSMLFILGYLKALGISLDIDNYSGLANGDVWNLH